MAPKFVQAISGAKAPSGTTAAASGKGRIANEPVLLERLINAPEFDSVRLNAMTRTRMRIN